jgi:aspartyl protease family protein
MTLDPGTRLPHYEDHSFSITVIVMTVIAALGGGCFYWYFMPQKQDYSAVYAQLGISSLPLNMESQPQIQNRLEQLSHEPCYRGAIIAVADALLEAGYPRETDTSLRSFAKRCGESGEILLLRYKALTQASDFTAALGIIDNLVTSDPADAQVRYWRGATYERLKDLGHALSDYINSVQLLGDPANVSVNNFYDISRMYTALGRYCDAITPIETCISFDPAKRRTTQYMRLISEFADKGNCDAQLARGSAHVSRLPRLGVSGVNTLVVVINGVSGNFLLDTGATYVAVTPEFSAKAKVSREAAIQLPIKTVGGSGNAELGYATTVAVGNAQAQGVVVAIIRGGKVRAAEIRTYFVQLRLYPALLTSAVLPIRAI